VSAWFVDARGFCFAETLAQDSQLRPASHRHHESRKPELKITVVPDYAFQYSLPEK